MPLNKLPLAIRATTALLTLGMASQAAAFQITAGDLKAELYGYARFNASYDFNENVANTTRSASFAKLENGSDAQNREIKGHFGADAIQSRLGVRVMTPEGVRMVVEGDFRGQGNTLRLRNAYGEYNGWLMGQNWSNYNSFVGNTPVLDFDGLAGTAGLQGRVAQVRYTATNGFSWSLEQPQTKVVDGNERTSLPTLTARFERTSDQLTYSAAALVHQVSFDDGDNSSSKMGYASFLAARLSLTDTVSIQGAINFSDGANAYLYRSGENFGAEDAYLRGNSLRTISGYGGTIGASFDLGDGRSMNIGYGLVTIDWDNAESDGAAVTNKSETNQNVMANYLWSPVRNVMLGIEYGYLHRENVSDHRGEAHRLLFAAQYNF
ncbi:MAG: hypothetical protein LAT63_13180 [Marinobacter sp.]|nr:hypothetical protein [Marinobacter sp.]